MSETELPPPGPALDKLVAEKMGHKVILLIDRQPNPVYRIEPPHKKWTISVPLYSVDGAAALGLVEWITEKRPDLLFTLTKYRYKQLYGAEFDGYKEYQASTAAHAICLAFLALPDEVAK